jgi:hypothetical protein
MWVFKSPQEEGLIIIIIIIIFMLCPDFGDWWKSHTSSSDSRYPLFFKSKDKADMDVASIKSFD